MLSNYLDSAGISDFPVDSIRYNFKDYWKIIQSISYNKDGNNTISNYTWESLTSFNSDDSNDFMDFKWSI